MWWCVCSAALGMRKGAARLARAAEIGSRANASARRPQQGPRIGGSQFGSAMRSSGPTRCSCLPTDELRDCAAGWVSPGGDCTERRGDGDTGGGECTSDAAPRSSRRPHGMPDRFRSAFGVARMVDHTLPRYGAHPANTLAR